MALRPQRRFPRVGRYVPHLLRKTQGETNVSTSYYGLRKPFTKVRLQEEKEYTRLRIWVNYTLVGTLALGKSETVMVLWALFDRQSPIMCTRWDRSKQCTVVSETGKADHVQVMSDCAELMTIRQVKARIEGSTC